MLRTNRLSIVFLALTVALGGCTEGLGTGVDGVDGELFNPAESAADLQIVQGVFSADMFESLNAASPNFNLVPDTAWGAPALIRAGWTAATANSHWEAQAAAQAFSAAGPAAGPLLPQDFLGRTYDRFEGQYRHNSDRTDAPVDGVRFILYEVDPVTHDQGVTEVGYVDLIDESTETAYVARVIVVTGGVEHINYTVSAVLGIQSIGFTVSGFISNGTDHVDVDLSMSFVNDAPVSTATVHHVIAVPTRDFEVDATVVMSFNSETLQGSMEIDGTFMQGTHTVTVSALVEFGEGDVPSEGGTLEISVDGVLFAVVTIQGDTITVRNALGGELDAVQAQHVRNIFDGLENLFDDRFEDFIRPVSWLFDH